MSTTFQIVSRDGHVYLHFGPRKSFHEVMLHVSLILTLAWNHQEDTFDALIKELAPSRHPCYVRNWTVQGEIVNPLGDFRGAMSTVYTFDLVKDILFFSDHSQNQKLPLHAFRWFRQGIMPTINHFTPFEHPSSPLFNSSAFHPPYWSPILNVPDRKLAFVGRILSDFNFQWRHILRRAYAESTFQRLTRAVLDIVTLNFNVVEESEPLFERRRVYYISGNRFPEKEEHYVSNNSFPTWEPHEKNLFSSGKLVVILEQDLEHAPALILDDIARRNDATNAESGIGERRMEERVYLLLSLRHVMLCHVERDDIPSYTQPITFMNGVDSPSTAAIIIILQAFAFAFPPPPHTRIHELPMEVQDLILAYAGEGHLDRARVGCLLGLGSPFNWVRVNDSSRAQGPMQRHIMWSPRDYNSPVEYEIHFGKIFSGVAYK